MNMRVLASILLATLMAACETTSGPARRVQVTDAAGNPIAGARFIPEYPEESTTHEFYSEKELETLVSNAQGFVPVDLEVCYWDTDASYHFSVHRAGYEAADLVVSRDLCPPVLKVQLTRIVAPRPAARPQPVSH